MERQMVEVFEAQVVVWRAEYRIDVRHGGVESC